MEIGFRKFQQTIYNRQKFPTANCQLPTYYFFENSTDSILLTIYKRKPLP